MPMGQARLMHPGKVISYPELLNIPNTGFCSAPREISHQPGGGGSHRAMAAAVCSGRLAAASGAASSLGEAVSTTSAGRASFGAFHGLRRSAAITSSEGIQRVRFSCATSRSEAMRQQRQLAVVAMSGGSGSLPSLNDIPLVNYINAQGRVQPPVAPNTAATVFAVFDQNKKIQYIGFSKDARNSLRVLLCRRPELCYYYKLHNLPALDQELMLNIRQQWFSELGLPPPGNKEPSQRVQWEKPASAGSISDRGKVAAANSKAKTVLQILADRGIKEKIEFDPALLEQGLVDVLPSQEQSQDELAKAAEEEAEAAAKRRQASVPAPNGDVVDFEIVFVAKYKTNGGWMYDILVNKDDKETSHRVICGRIYPESVKMPEDRFLERVMGFLLYQKVQRRTEGLIAGGEFPINYFSVSEVAQRFEAFKDWFPGELPDSYWRFNRIHAYGAELDPAPQTGPLDKLAYTLSDGSL